MSKKLATPLLNTRAASSLKADIESSAYYVFTAKYTPYANTSDDIIPNPQYSRSDISSVYDSMIFGRRVKSNDVRQMIKRYDWSSGQVFDQYDDKDTSLDTKKFYSLVSDGTTYNVYKCLFNNGGAQSITQPYGQDEYPFETPEDGYMWKYMYTISDFEYRRFATQTYIPITDNTTTTITPGTIDTFVIEQGGRGYNNYTVGSFASGNDVYVNGDTSLFSLESGSNTNKFYVGCVIKITSGLANNQYREIVDYYISGGQRIIRVDLPFSGQVKPTDTYEVYPKVYVYDTGNSSTTPCVARALINGNAANSIYAIEVLSTGSNYRTAVCTLLPDPSVGVDTPASLRPVVSPPNGHGSSIEDELFARYVGVSTSFIGNTEVFTTENDFRTIGLLRNPLYANVSIDIVTEDTKGSFAAGETIYHYRPLPIQGLVSLNANSVITSDTIDLPSVLRVGDNVIVSDGVRNHFSEVVLISEVGAHVADVPSFASSNCSMSYVDVKPFGQLTSVSPSSLVATNITPSDFNYSIQVVGDITSTTSTLDVSNTYPLRVNGRSLDSFSSFLQLTKLVGTVSGGEFIKDELVTQAADDLYTPRAIFHSIEDNLDGTYTMFLINVNKGFSTTQEGGTGLIVGETSGAQFVAQYKYESELIRDSGELIYIENINAVSRSPDQSETIKLILEC